MILLAINWSNVWMQVFYLILSLSILVILHEFGHYITAKWFGCRVEKFYLFFNPGFSLVKKKIGETEYGIGWLPLGGYVKISGMIDESMDKEAMKQPAKAYEFRSKPAWQRLIIMLGGIIVNVLLAFIIYAMVLFVWGESKVINSTLKDGIWIQDSVLFKAGFLNGDRIESVDGKTFTYFDDIQPKLLLSHQVTIIRNGEKKVIEMPEKFIAELIKSKKKSSGLMMPRLPALVGKYEPKDSSNGKKAGLQFMDKIVKVDSFPIAFYDDIVKVLADKQNQQVKIFVERNGNLDSLLASVNAENKIGIPVLTDTLYDSLGYFKVDLKKYGFFEALPAGVSLAWDKLSDYVGQFKMILNPKTEAYKGLGGFKAIGSIFPTHWGDWQTFWRLTGFLSIILAFMNLLPIPALDGGHVLFTLVEMITGRKPSDKFLEYAQIVGMVLLLSLMLFANYNDWFGYGRGR